MSRRWITAAFAAIIFLTFASEALAWGPGTHVKLASDILSNLWMLPTSLAALLASQRRFFVYGNVATDTVFAKKMSRIKQVCHRWSTGMSLLESARTDGGKAFAYGYLAHLAADTVAHNKFLPRQMAVCRSTVAFGHLYWEIRADALIDRPHWLELRSCLRDTYGEPEHLLESHLRQTMLSFGTNRVIFKRMNLLASQKTWQRSVQFWARLSRFGLDPDIIADYHLESFERIIDILSHGPRAAVLHEDPNGNSSLAYAKVQRRLLRQMRRAHLSDDHVRHEAAVSHAPNRPKPALHQAPS